MSTEMYPETLEEKTAKMMWEPNDPAEPPRLAVKVSAYTHKSPAEDQKSIIAVLEEVLPGVSRGISIRPLISSLEADEVARLVERAACMDPDYKPVDFSSWTQVHLTVRILKDPACGNDFNLARPSDVDELVRRLNERHEIESVSTMRPVQPPMAGLDPDPRELDEKYHQAAGVGIDSEYARTFPGGDGTDIGFVDVDTGWNLNHEDLVSTRGINLISGLNRAPKDHGTAALGVIMMARNGIGGGGIAPNCNGRVISLYRNTYEVASTIAAAVAVMQFGDVLLLEAQGSKVIDSEDHFRPLEITLDVYEAIRLATALGIVVIEPAGNGNYNLEDYTDCHGKKIFDSASPDFRDSGAIMVGAASSTEPHSRMNGSNYGSRVDLYGWGQNIDTTYTDAIGTDNKGYTTSFDGTSGASAIVAGAAIVVQGIAQASLTYRFSPLELRKILGDTGTRSKDKADRIGKMPNLRAIIDGDFLRLSPNFYLREYLGDDGSVPTAGLVSLSPDIIVLQAPVRGDPQTLFGEHSLNRDSNTISQDVLAGQENAIYVRLRNRGGSEATDVSVTVYYSPQSTLPMPNTWTLIGTVTLPSVPAGNSLTVSPLLPWRAPAEPSSNYTFIAVAGNDKNPAQKISDLTFSSLPNYIKFIENNNKVASRNFSVIPAPPPDGAGTPHRFPILIPGAFYGAQIFTLEGIGSLPRGSRVVLEVPLMLARQLRVKLQESQIRGDIATLPLHPFARSTIGTGVLPPSSLAKCNLLVCVPEETYNRSGTYEFAVRQLYQGREVGRVTWHFGQPALIKCPEGDGCEADHC
ncbi:MAG: hypothetical protein M1839_008341 [Geoglossum umbratile]|nr:MAG: hypothetical protein M1839_008341 [Geoglossum umbratile]